MLLTTSCGEDTKGTSFEVQDANNDESVNPAHIRGYHTEAPGMFGAPKVPNQYYPFSTKTLPADVRQQLEGNNIAVRMVTIYYSPNGSLRDLAEEFNPSGEVGNTTNSPSDTGGGGNGSTESGNTGSGNGTGNSGNGNSNSSSGNSSSGDVSETGSGNDQN